MSEQPQTWTGCPECAHGQPMPTLREAIREVQICWNCGNARVIPRDEADYVLDQLGERLL